MHARFYNLPPFVKLLLCQAIDTTTPSYGFSDRLSGPQNRFVNLLQWFLPGLRDLLANLVLRHNALGAVQAFNLFGFDNTEFRCDLDRLTPKAVRRTS
jgi:hypothetical protein